MAKWQNGKMAKSATAALLVLGFATTVNTASAGAKDDVKALLTLAELAAVRDGYTETHDKKYDYLRSGSSDDFRITLRRGKKYKIVAMCDGDCKDIDTRLYDENDNLVESDTKSDSAPILTISPKWTGKFRLKVSMISCSANPCAFGVSTFAKDR